MNNIEDIVFDPELGIDADLESLLVQDGVNLLSLQVFGHWRRGFSEEEIGEYFDTNPKEVESMVSLVQGLVPPERLALDQKNRDEILKIKSESIDLNEKFKESLSKTPDAHMQEGWNPASVLKQFRESIAAGEPSVISGLRERDGNIEIGEITDELTLEEESQLIAELRQDGNQRFKNTVAKDQYSHGVSSPSPPVRGKVAKVLSGNNSGVKKPDSRITIRMGADVYEKLDEQSNRLGLDRSFIVREAVQKYLDHPSGQSGNQALPPEIFKLTPPFRAWSGDLRVELQDQLNRLLALSSVATKHYPKTRGLREIFTTLLTLYQQLKTNGVGHDAK